MHKLCQILIKINLKKNFLTNGKQTVRILFNFEHNFTREMEKIIRIEVNN